MKATGTLTFRRVGEFITHEWVGGRRIEISGEAFDALRMCPRVGEVYHFGSLRLRLVGLAFSEGGTMRDSWIAMQDGLLAWLTVRYSAWLMGVAPKFYRWECKWIWRRKVTEGEVYHRSITAMLLLPLI